MAKNTFSSLPFVEESRKGVDLWHVDPDVSYAEACRQGEAWAVQLAEFLKNHDDLVGSGLTHRIFAAMDFESDAKKGYAIGFVAFIERLLYLCATDYDLPAFHRQIYGYYAAEEARLRDELPNHAPWEPSGARQPAEDRRQK